MTEQIVAWLAQKENKWMTVAAVLGGVVILSIGLVWWGINTPVQQVPAEEQMTTVSLAAEPDETQTNVAVWYVDVKGAVQKPGVYPAKEGMRVQDVINLAGGLRQGADEQQVNLAQLVTDEMVIAVPHMNESVTMAQTNSTTARVNLNTATKEELMQLKGIGEKKAEAIIALRQKQRIKRLEDLKAIKGMSDKLLEAMREFVSV